MTTWTLLAGAVTLLYGVYFVPVVAGMAVTAWATRRFFEELASCR